MHEIRSYPLPVVTAPCPRTSMLVRGQGGGLAARLAADLVHLPDELAGVRIDVTRHAGFASKHSRLHPAHETEALHAVRALSFCLSSIA